MRGSLLSILSHPRRLAQIGGVLLAHYVAHGCRSLLRRIPWLGSRLAAPRSGPERFRKLLERLGGTFIKFGQVLALQPDLLPRDYCDALFDLMDRVAPFPYSGVEKVFREDLGRGPEEVFDRFERAPVGAASIGQVHIAYLGDRKLAVKVQRPDAEAVFGGDIRLMKLALKWIHTLRIRGLTFLTRPIEEFVGWTGEELDYRTEARYMDQLAANSRDQEGEQVPDVVWELTSRRILVADFLEGVTLLDYLRGREEGDSEALFRARSIGFRPERFAKNILENFLGDVFHHGLFHADLHPANLLILPDNVVGYVDFGISGAISRYARRHLMAAVLALTRADMDELANRFLSISRVDADTDIQAFRRSLKARADRWYEGVGESRERTVSYSVMMLDMIHVCRRHDVFPHGETLRYMRSVVTADGLIARVAPEVDVDTVLERRCSDLFASEALKIAFSANRVIESWAAGTRLLRDGAARLESLLARAEGGDRERDTGRRAPAEGRRPPSGGRALAFALLVAANGLLLSQTPGPVRLGLNVFSAELLLLTGASVLLLGSTFRWLFSTS